MCTVPLFGDVNEGYHQIKCGSSRFDSLGGIIGDQQSSYDMQITCVGPPYVSSAKLSCRLNYLVKLGLASKYHSDCT